MAGKGSVWTPLKLTNTISTGRAVITNLPDGSVLATGVNPTYDTYQIEAESDSPVITAVLLEVLPDPSLPKNGPGRWGKTGNFILDEMGMKITQGSGKPTTVFFRTATADWEQDYYRAEHAVDQNPKTGWAIGPRFGERRVAVDHTDVDLVDGDVAGTGRPVDRGQHDVAGPHPAQEGVEVGDDPLPHRIAHMLVCIVHAAPQRGR